MTMRRTAALPHPLHLFRHLTRSDHYHFGLFPPAICTAGASESATIAADQDDPLARALDRLAHHVVSRLPGGSRVLDVGCGMGGTAKILARRGIDVVGVDPAQQLIEYARSTPGESTRPQFLNCAVEAMPLNHPGETFDVMVCTEVLHHFPRLTPLFEVARVLLRPSGRVLLHDLALNGAESSSARPFHTRGSIAEAAAHQGFFLERREDLTRRIRPTLSLLTERLDLQSDEIRLQFAASRPRISAEIDELRAQLRNLALGIDEGFLTYEGTILKLDESDHR